MADSSLVTVERLTSTKCRKNRIDNSGVKHTVDTITIHCTAGNKNSTAVATVNYWTNNNVDASSQYVVGGDGSVCQNVLEADRAWTTGGLSAEQMKNMGRNYETGSANDYHAITIEVASNSSGTEVTDAALNKTIDLVTDICKRHGKTVALWFGDNATKMVNYKPASNEMKFTWHIWFAQKSCPGKFIMDHMQYIIDTVNSRLAGQPQPQPQPQPTDIEQFMWNAFKYLGEYGCAGLLANLKCESAYKSTNLQGSFEKKFGMDDLTYTAAVDNNAWDFVNDHAGYGLAQWTYYSRKQDLLNYAKAKNVSIGDLNMQIEFCKQELDGYKLTDKLKNCKSAKEASDLVMTVYEKPADQSEAALKKRSDIAEQIYNTYTGVKPSKNYLEKGDSGEDVKVMQTMLIKCGYSCGNSGADGIFGSNTDKAVRAFQAAKNLDVDGLYGPKTKAALEAEYNKSELYRVRKSWEDSKSQIGAYRVYDNAVKQCNENPGYSVYDSNGKCVYTTKKSNEDIAKEVIQGKWGNGTERKQRLTAAGYDYSTVQNIVNQMLK